MQNALNVELQRIKPLKGTSGLCPGCFNKVIAKCGEINIHHFAHESVSDCEGSKEESEWHLAWKARFPECDQERFQTNLEGKTRRADVRGFGYVFEFQTILPDSSEIRARQEFWQQAGFKFAWVFKKEGTLFAKRIEQGSYKVWNFAHKYDEAALPFFLDDPHSGFCLRVDSFERRSPAVAYVEGQMMPRLTCDMLF